MTRHSDQDTAIHVLRKAVGDFVATRKWTKYHVPKDLALSIVLEAAELLEIWQWTGEDCWYGQCDERIAEEVADIVIYCLSLCNVLGIDLTQAVLAKVQKNAEKYPVGGEDPWKR